MKGAKLNDKKIRKIIRWKEKGFETSRIAKKVGVTPRRVQQIWKEYKETGEIPKIKRRGRKPKKISKEEIDLVLKAVEEYKGTSAVHLEKYIESKHNIHIPHNRIYTISYIYYTEGIRPHPQEKEEKKKKKPKRFSASKPNEMWQMDFKIVNVDGVRYNLLLIIDDHSRFILHAGIYEESTTDVVISALEECFEKHGTPKKILTDNGTQFVPARGGISRFQKFLMEREILHIKTSIRHPQTIGKVERINREVEYRLDKFNNLKEFVEWHNQIKPHRSLSFKTPYEVYFENTKCNKEVIT
ncbi:hypothetical protein Metig_0390 [Methanotorris igneus Kol 5]|uniref:Integrase catalytic domain-containing protein n=2 Tax=Methanotorris igneus TaxID=2189 RepID=F6BB61_METIK|nr:hypothetical protein Metig_0390 [Methanotorris igneus Kol 5]